MNDELCADVAHHLADSEDDLIDGLVEAHITEIEGCGVVQDLDAEEDDACCD